MKSFIQFIITEGGAGGHIAHAFDISTNGLELIGVFEDAVDYINNSAGAVKIDGVNVSSRLVNGKFVIDRGSANLYDIAGISKEDLRKRFMDVGDRVEIISTKKNGIIDGKSSTSFNVKLDGGSIVSVKRDDVVNISEKPKHGFVVSGGKVLDIFNSSIPYIKAELKELGMLDNPNILMDIEFVEGTTNVIGYGKNFIAIHGLKEIKPKNIDPKTGKIKSRVAVNLPIDKNILNSIVTKMDKVANKSGFEVVGNVSVDLKKKPNFRSVLSEKLLLNHESKTLLDWLKGVNFDTSKESLITKKDYLELSKGDKSNLTPKQLNDYIVYYATIALGDEILKNSTSKLGDLDKQEGIVIKDKDGSYYKITGSFIINGMSTSFGAA